MVSWGSRRAVVAPPPAKARGGEWRGQKKAGPPEGPCLIALSGWYDAAALVLFPPAGDAGETGKTGAEQQHRGGLGDGVT